MKFVIIGAGMAGLYCCYSLVKKYGITDVLVIEKNERLGGRIHSLDIGNDITIELGAGVITWIAKNELRLVNELELDQNLIKGKSGGRHYLDLESVHQNNDMIYKIKNYKTVEEFGFYDVLEDLWDRIKKKKITSKMVD